MTLDKAVRLLRDAGVPSPEHDARELFEHFGGIPHAVPVSPGIEINSPELDGAIARRAQREPLQYIIGHAYFYRECYEVNGDCLIPRSDTEILVDYAVSHLLRGARLLDLCTGSGCIAISTLANTYDTTATAVDISDGALALAKKNAEKNGVSDRIDFVRCDLLDCDGGELGEGYDAVLSNPPYIPRAVYEGLEKEIYHEPSLAFVGGEDGRLFYERLIPLALSVLKDGGFIALEIGYDQGELITGLARENGCDALIIKDYSGNDRVVVLRPV